MIRQQSEMIVLSRYESGVFAAGALRPVLFLVALVVAGVGPAAHAGGRSEWKTKVGGTSYLIRQADDGVVSVVSKALLTGRTMKIRDEMRVAVRQATGCDLVDELWFDAKLKGKFSCPAGQATSSGAEQGSAK